MMRRTTPRHALPLIKLLILATRQVTKPFAKMVVSSATEVKAINTLCIAMGRFVLGSTGVLKQESAKQRAALEEKAKAKQRETELIAHVIIEVEDRLKGELDDLRRQLAEAQEAHNALLGSLEGREGPGDPPLGAYAAGITSTPSNESSLPGNSKERRIFEKNGSEKVPDLNSSAATSCASAPPPHIYVCPMGTYNRPALPTHKTIFGTDNNPPIFPPEPRIETGPYTIPVVAIEVPLGDLAETIKARGGAGSSVTEERAAAAEEGGFCAGTPNGIPPSIDHVQPPQYAVGPSTSTTSSTSASEEGSPAKSSVSSNDAASPSASSSSTGLPTDADQHFRISAIPTVSVLNASSNSSSEEATATQSSTSDSSCGSGGIGMTVSGGAASVAVGAPKATPSPSSSAARSIGGNERATASKTSTSVGGDSGAHTSSNKKPKGGFNFHKTINQAFQDRYYSRVSDDTLRKAGAEMLVELVAFSILSIILTYEFVMSKKSEQAREKAQLERITALEQKVNEIAATHDSSIAALTVGTSDLDGWSLYRRVFGGGKHAPTVDDEVQTEGDSSAQATASDDSQLDINQRMLRRGLTP